MSAANFGRDATHAQRVTGLPGFAESEMTGEARQGPKLLCYFLEFKKVKAVSLFGEA